MEIMSAQTLELFKYFGIKPPVTGKNVGIQIDSCQLSNEEVLDFLIDGNLPEKVIKQSLLDKQPAKDDM